MTGFALICAVTAGYCLLAKRLSQTILTAPMLFIALGCLLSVTGVVGQEGMDELLHPVAEIALVVLLFLDAAQTDFEALRRRRIWPLRMLLIGMPLSILLGTFLVAALLPDWPIAMMALVAAILTPTDAALGQAVVSNPKVPERSRRALTVESGLNDGLALPAILMLAAIAAEDMSQTPQDWLLFGVMQVTLGPLAGAAVGLIGGAALLKAKAHRTTSAAYEGIGAIALAGGAYFLALYIGGNGFISAFAAGLCFGAVVKGRCKFVYEFTEGEGQMLAWAAFLLLGAAMVPDAVAHLTWPMLALILISLLVVRPLAIWLSLMGTDAPPVTRLFFGWFGPRGLATALFALQVAHMLPHETGETLLHLAINAVWISAVLHGLSAAPGATWYGTYLSRRNGASQPTPQQS